MTEEELEEALEWFDEVEIDKLLLLLDEFEGDIQKRLDGYIRKCMVHGFETGLIREGDNERETVDGNLTDYTGTAE